MLKQGKLAVLVFRGNQHNAGARHTLFGVWVSKTHTQAVNPSRPATMLAVLTIQVHSRQS